MDEIIYIPPLQVKRQFTLVNEAQVMGLELPYPLCPEYQGEDDGVAQTFLVHPPSSHGGPYWGWYDELLPDQDPETEKRIQTLEDRLTPDLLPSPHKQEVWIVQEYPARGMKDILRAVKRKYYRLHASGAQSGEPFIPFRVRSTDDFDDLDGEEPYSLEKKERMLFALSKGDMDAGYSCAILCETLPEFFDVYTCVDYARELGIPVKTPAF
jgi:hypothetical protein